ncbi:hypothetical protein [Nonomuraea lactucae]|uniref:hypothetical protein n=1 Tax=Nonomuraea lactucae TaxID=2249762 RepID=UPI000DE2C612|nr:hypothetical protein [Nonomuraea lactucae]
MTIDFRHAPDSSWTLICRPDDPHKTLVREDGALLYGFHASAFDAWHFDAVVELSAQTTHTPVRVTQRTESARRAIVHTVVEYPNQTLKLTAFAGYGSGRHDIVLWTVTASAEVLTGLRVDAYLRGSRLAGAGAAPHHRVYAVPETPAPVTADWTDGLPTVDSVPDGSWSLSSLGHPLVGVYARGFRPASGLMTRPVVLMPGESVSGAIVVPLDGGGEPDLPRARSMLLDERRYWDALEVQPLALEVPDPDVQDMLTASARNMLQARELEDGLPVLHVGPTIYRGLWLVDGHFLLEAARYLGLDDTADAGLDVLMRRVKPDGSIIQLAHEPHIKETGIAIATMVRQAQLTGDLDGLRRRWPTVLGAVAHIAELRAKAAALPADHPLHGLLPEAFGDGGLGGSRPEYTTAAWLLIGLKNAAMGARMLGEEAGELDGAYQDLLDTFKKSAAAQRRLTPDGSLHYLPMAPGGDGTHQFLPHAEEHDVPPWRAVQPETATWALCHAVWPGEVFAPDDTVVTDLLSLLESRDGRQGIPATTGWLPYRAVWTYAASFAAHAFLYGGRPGKAADYLYGFANHASPTRVWREEQPFTGSGHPQICGDMPHNWASAEFVRLVRHMLVFERGDGLDLLPGVPRGWVEPGSAIRVERTPTRFGRVTLDARASEEALEVRVSREAAPGPDPVSRGDTAVPGQVTATLRLPAAFAGEVRVDGVTVRPYPSVRLRLGDGADVHVVASRRPSSA